MARTIAADQRPAGGAAADEPRYLGTFQLRVSDAVEGAMSVPIQPPTAKLRNAAGQAILVDATQDLILSVGGDSQQ